MANVRIPIQTKYDGQAFKRAQQDAARLRRLQERHNRAVLSETRQQIREQRRLATLSRKLERDLQREAAATAARRKQAFQSQAAVLAAGTALAVRFGQEAIEASREQAKAEAQLEAALQSTGGAAGLTARELKDLASQLQDVTNFGDEATIRAEALLLTFTNVGETVFPRATRAILDMSTAMDKDLGQTTLQVGKWLNDLSRGVTGAREVGIQFTDAQEKQIKTLLEAGRVTEAQGVFLAELERQFGGSAEAARQADGGIIALSNSWGDLKEAIGRAITPSTEGINDLIDLIDSLADRVDRASDGWREFTKNADIFTIGLHNLVFEGTSFGDAFAEAGREVETAWKEVEPPVVAVTDAIDDNTDALEDNSAALDEQLKKLEETTRIRQDAARELLDIEKQAAEDVDKIYEDFWDSENKSWADYLDNINDLRKKAGKEAEKDEKDLAKRLAKVDADANKQITKLQADAAKEQKYEAKRRQVDVLADERLFNFDLQQLAAEGQGNAIREAIERRAIEEQIAKDKAAVESDIEKKKLGDQINTIRQTAAERKAQLRTDNEEEQQLRDERLAEDEVAEYESYLQRLDQFREYREEKLTEAEASKQEAIAALGEELAEAGDLTRSELAELSEAAGKLGEDVGKSFAEGITRGYETNQKVDELLGSTPGAPSSLTPGMPHPGLFPRFQGGGIVPGPIGQPRLIMAHGGETFTPPSGAGGGGATFSPTIHIHNPVFGNAVTQNEVNGMIWGALQQYTDNVIGPWAS